MNMHVDGVDCEIGAWNKSALFMEYELEGRMDRNLFHHVGNIPGKGDVRYAVFRRYCQTAPHGMPRQVTGIGCGWTKTVNLPGHMEDAIAQGKVVSCRAVTDAGELLVEHVASV